MEENYLHIFCTFLANLYETEKFDLNDVAYISFELQPHADNLHTREDLLRFLSAYTEDYPEFLPLEQQLSDPNHSFS